MAESLTTAQSAVDRARENSSFRFTRSSAEVYRWIRDTDPRLFSEIRTLVRRGRWEVVGGWIEQPDCNLPSAESFVRQSLLGQAWLKEHLGVTAQIGYNVDSFGHAGGLPQLLRRAGFTHYVFMRPQRHESPHVPDLFWWESQDGSRVLTQRVPGEYSQRPNLSADELETLVRTTHERHFSPGFDDGVFWLGIGNHGGGPTREHLARIQELQQDPSLPELRFSTVARYFAAVERSSAFAQLTTIRSELQFHARGCYVATSQVKQLNRSAEQALFVAETLLCTRSASRLVPVRGEGSRELREAWWQLLFNQFHDILAGTCVASAWDETRDRLGASLHAAERAAQRELHRLARSVDTRGESGSVLFAFNPLPWRRTALIQLDTFSDPHGRAPITHLQTRDGTAVPLQWLPAEANYGPHLMPWGKLSAAIEIPAGGYAVHRLATGSPVKPPPRRRVASPISLSRRGGITSWRTASGAELLAEPIALQAIADESDTWAHGVRAFDGATRPLRLVRHCTVATGPLCRVSRQQFAFGHSEVWLDTIEHRWTKAIELRVRLDWREQRTLLTLAIPTRLKRSDFVAKTPAAVTVRPTDGEEQPGHEWTALSGLLSGKKHTAGLVNAQSYSHACRDGTLRTLLVRSSRFAEHDPRRVEAHEPKPWVDHGWHERRFWLVEGPGDWRDIRMGRQAAELLTNTPCMLDSAHPGSEPWEKSFFELRGEHLSVLACKPAETGRGIVVRVQEMAGQTCAGRLSSPWTKRAVAVRFAPWEIKTLLCREDGRIEATTLLEQRLT